MLNKMNLEALYKVIMILLRRNKKEWYVTEVKKQYRILLTGENFEQKQDAWAILREVFHPKGLLEDVIYGRSKVEWSGERWCKLANIFLLKAKDAISKNSL